MNAQREKDSADFDLESFIELFDEALTSDDPSVQKALQHLMVIASLARNHNAHGDRRYQLWQGPMRRLFEDVKNLQLRLEKLETKDSTHAQNSAMAKSTTSYAFDPPNSAGETIAERVDDLLKSNYKGSSVGTVDVKIS